MNKRCQLIVALDVATFEEARTLVDTLSECVDVFKVGSQLFTACGPIVVRYIQAKGKKVFLDLKYHDIPNTVANAVKTAVGLSVPGHEAQRETKKTGPYQPLFMLTVHIEGGEEMLKAAVRATQEEAKRLKITPPLIVGITVLTSEGKANNIKDIVLEKARLARACGLDGVVASSLEAIGIRRSLGKDFIIVTPGIRSTGAESGDQKRVATPADAVKSGSNFLVVGRPIVKAQNPLEAAKAVLKEIKDV